jgi:nucleoside-diphosphate-sugar epimerase
MAVLVTGGTGFIGSNVARILATERGEDVVILDVRGRPTDPGSPLAALDERITYVIGSVTDMAALTHAIVDHRVDTVVNGAALLGQSAAMRPVEALTINVIGTAHVLEAARIHGLRRVVQISSSAVMGAPEDLSTPRREEEVVIPLTGIYPLSKFADEQLVNTYRRLYGVDAVAVRPRSVYGPGAYPGTPTPVKNLVEAACRGEDIVRESGSDTVFELSYVKDIARGIISALYLPESPPYHVYNLSYGENVTLAAALGALRELFPHLRIEIGPGLWEGVSASGGQRDLVYRSLQRPPQDIGRARADLGYVPKWPVQRAIPDYVRWLKEGSYGSVE